MPIPVSVMFMVTCLFWVVVVRVILPVFGVNFRALESRLSMTCPRRCSSA